MQRGARNGYALNESARAEAVGEQRPDEVACGGRGLAERMAAGEMRPDFGPPALHSTAGATLVAAREPLVAFNLELAPRATIGDAHRIAALIREGGAVIGRVGGRWCGRRAAARSGVRRLRIGFRRLSLR